MGSNPTMTRSGRTVQIDPQDLLAAEDEPQVSSKKESYSVSELTKASKTSEEKTERSVETKPTPTQTETRLASNKLVVAQPTEKKQNAVSMDVQFVRDYINRYIDYVSKLRANPEVSIRLFVDIVRFVINHQSNPEVLNELYVFFKTYKSSILDYTKVMQACTTIRPKTKEQVGTVWILMTELVNGRKTDLAWDRAIEILGGSGLVDYVRKRMQSFNTK